MAGPLSGIRIVDFSRVLAGPLCARTLQDLGAEVIKIEPPSPDVSRFAFPSTDGMSGYYAQQNAGKRNVSINLNVPGAYELALKLCDTSVTKAETPDQVVPAVQNAVQLAFGDDRAAAVLLSQKLIGRKVWVK